MKKFILIVFAIISFGIAKANVFTPKTFMVTELNHLKNYDITFKFIPQKTYFCGPAPKAVSFQNKLAIENSGNTVNISEAKEKKFGN